MAYGINETKIKEYALQIDECERNFAKRFSAIAEDICNNRGLRIVRLYGPTCSGKTTASRLLTDMFSKLGRRAHTVSIDDFFYEREFLLNMSREKGLDFVDYDSPDTIDTAALHIFAEEIFACKELHCPTYDFMTGKISGYRTLSVGENDIFIFEGIQACYPNVKDMLSDHGSASIFIAPLSSVSAGGKEFAPNRLRLMRRLVRDYHFRGASAEFTFKLWQGVRENERKNIFPYAEESDYKVDSAMAYEVGVLKPFLCEILSSFDPKNEFAAKAEEILQSVKNVETIPGELITDNYLYSEFV